MTEDATPPQAQPAAPAPTVAPHRGTMILIFGILSIPCCFIFGIVAWVMANNDLREMAAGRMDRSGEGLTNAGRICGIIGIVIQILAFIFNMVTGAFTAMLQFHQG